MYMWINLSTRRKVINQRFFYFFKVKLNLKKFTFVLLSFHSPIFTGNIKLVEEHPVEAAGVATVAGLVLMRGTDN